MTSHREEGIDLFGTLAAPDPGAQARLHDRLVARAQDAGILDVAYRTLDTPVGVLLLASTGKGLVRVAFESQSHDSVLEAIAAELSPRILHAPGRLDAASRQLEEYFAGVRRSFDLPLDLSLAHGFRRAVLRRLLRIAYGRTASYASVAVAAGSPGAVRAVGTACATNPIPVIVPCHRVVRSDGSLGEYAGGSGLKRALLALETAP